MQLGSLLDSAKHQPAVSHPVKFKLCAQNKSAQPTSVEVEALLAYVGEEERIESAVVAAEALAKKFKARPVPDKERQSEEAIHFLALALRDKQDPARVLADGGVDQLRPALLYSTTDWLMKEYLDFVRKEYHPAPPVEDLEKMKEEAQKK